MTRTRPVLLCSVLVALAVLAGCVGSGPEGLKRTYAFSPPAGPAQAPAEGAPVVGVPLLQVSPLFRDAGFVYRFGSQRFHQDYYNEFVLPPAHLVTQALRQSLAATGRFTVVSPDSMLAPRYVLEGTLVQIYADEPAGQAVLELQLRLLDNAPRTRQLLWHRTYRRTPDLPEFGPDAAMIAWDAALQDILSEVIADLPELTPADR